MISSFLLGLGDKITHLEFSPDGLSDGFVAIVRAANEFIVRNSEAIKELPKLYEKSINISLLEINV